MDLNKLLEHRKQTWRRASVPNMPLAQQFLFQLSNVLQQDLRLLSKCTPPDEGLSFSAVKIITGKFESEGSRSIKNNINPVEIDYLYIQIPCSKGYLFQIKSNKLVLERAVHAVPHMTDFYGEAVRRNLFVTYSPVLEEMKVLDENTVRTSADKTLSLTQCSEMLISLAFDVLEASLQEWVRN